MSSKVKHLMMREFLPLRAEEYLQIELFDRMHAFVENFVHVSSSLTAQVHHSVVEIIQFVVHLDVRVA